MRGRFARGVLRFGLLGLLAATLVVTVLVGSSAAADPPAGCSTTAAVTTCVFAHTGAAQTWTVPAGVNQATFDLYGAQGEGNPARPEFAPGLGGRATATLAVAAGDSIQVNVGGQGFTGSVNNGGFNGGGAGSGGTGGGGGASDIRVGGAAFADRALVAGGGGGAGRSANTNSSSAGGAGGGESGLPGGPGGFANSVAGGGGTQTMGGSAGAGATPGGVGVGGVGALGGGGGGGGWYGGGGGVNAGGGGGSGFISPEATSASMQTGVRSGNGLVTIAYSELDAQLANLLAAVTGLPPGKALANKVKAIEAAVAANDTAGACAGLASLIELANAQTGKKLSEEQADGLTDDANAIRELLDC
jgi:hypothetical protein